MHSHGRIRLLIDNKRKILTEEVIYIRIRFGNHIDLCKRVSCSGDIFLIITTIYNSVYTVNCKNESTASKSYEEILTNGYLDVSEFEYSN